MLRIRPSVCFFIISEIRENIRPCRKSNKGERRTDLLFATFINNETSTNTILISQKILIVLKVGANGLAIIRDFTAR